MSEEKNRFRSWLPIATMLLATLLTASVFIGQEADQTKWETISKQYQQTLLQRELPIYVEYVTRRWNIERIGSEGYLAELHTKSNQSSYEELTKMILMDKSFYHYLNADGHLLMPRESLRELLGVRLALYQQLDSMNEFRFGLSGDRFTSSDLFSQVFAETNSVYFLYGLILLLISSVLVELEMGSTKICILWICSSLISSVVYLLVADMFSPTYQGISGILLSTAFACVSLLFFRLSDSVGDVWAQHKKEIVFLVLFSAALIVEVLLYLTEKEFAVSYVLASVMASVCGILFTVVRKKILTIAKAYDDAIAEENEWPFRVEFAKAMNKISQFRFDSARKDLRELHRVHPDSTNILLQQYQLEKLEPESTEYWRCANELIELAERKKDYARMSLLFKDIQKNAATKQMARQSLKPESYHKMMMVFVAYDQLAKAEHAYLFLELGAESEIRKEACKLLINEFRIRGLLSKQQQYQMLYERMV